MSQKGPGEFSRPAVVDSVREDLTDAKLRLQGLINSAPGAVLEFDTKKTTVSWRWTGEGTLAEESRAALDEAVANVNRIQETHKHVANG